MYKKILVAYDGSDNAIFGRIMGSTTGSISRLAPCSVLIVK